MSHRDNSGGSSNASSRNSSPSSQQPSPQPRSTQAPNQPQPKKKTSRPSKARLTTSQKNTNHRDAENKRRDGIRAEQEKMSRLIPGAENDAKSDEKLLNKTATYLEKELTQIRQMIAEADAKGVPVKQEWRELVRDEDFGGVEYKTPNMDDFEEKKAKAEARRGGGGGGGSNVKSNDDVDGGDED